MRDAIGEIWSIVLAGGEGTRLRPLTAGLGMGHVPKQYWSLGGGGSLLRRALERSASVVARDRILVVVAERHREWWEPELRDLPGENVLVQPEARGTAAGILLPLLRIKQRDAAANVVVMPSDHHIDLEGTFAWALHQAVASLREAAERLVLLGIAAESAEPGLGWIVPGTSGEDPVRRVDGFAEKPATPEAERLRALGALVNSFVFAARVETLVRQFELRLPDLALAFHRAIGPGGEGWTADGLASLYRDLPSWDFSRDLLEAAVPELGVIPVPSCGWTDLGTPERVAECLARRPRAALSSSDLPPLDLARAIAPPDPGFRGVGVRSSSTRGDHAVAAGLLGRV